MDSVAGPELPSVARPGNVERIASRPHLNENRGVQQPHQNRPVRPPRSESREVVELKKLKESNPELTSAVDMQLALVELQRRVQSRVPIPALRIDQARVMRLVTDRRPLLAFEEIPLDWTEMRLMVRQTVDILRRFDSLDEEGRTTLHAIARQPEQFQEVVRRWYQSTASGDSTAASTDATGMLDQVLSLAMRPFLARCAETLLPQLDLAAWDAARCPLCGGEPEFATITPAADRLLLCGRCTGAWHFHPLACPFCDNRDRTRITSFASRDGRYRLYGCDVCHRYIKAFDGRHAARGALLAVDTVATLPLDAAAIQKGYLG
jgi:formate dehydrogenase maturation protein FdhE